MNEKEKKAIEELSKKAVICNYKERDYPNMICFKKDMIIVLNLIKKLQKENEKLKNQEAAARKINELLVQRYSNSIPVQKVKDKIEKEIKYHERNILEIENTTMLKGKTAKEEAEIEFNKYAIVVLKKMLQELLEGRK